jgi:bla regulator protein BlaR1
MSERFIAWGFETLFAFTLLLLLVLLVRRPVANRFGAQWAYALWLLPALRLILPPLPSIGGIIALPSPALFIPALATEAAAPLPTGGGLGLWGPFLLALWGGGAAVFILYQIVGYRAFLRELRAGQRPAGVPCEGIPVIESEAVDGPIAIGLLDRRIIVPPLFAYRYSPAERALALEHELIHHRRLDLWWNGAALAALALNWFNPIAHFAFRAFRIDQELACDAAVSCRSPGMRHEYARALVKSGTRPGQVATCPMYSADQLKRRLKMLHEHRKGRGRTLGGAACVTLVLLIGLILTAPTYAASGEDAATQAAETHLAVLETQRAALADHQARTGECRAEKLAAVDAEIAALRKAGLVRARNTDRLHL